MGHNTAELAAGHVPVPGRLSDPHPLVAAPVHLSEPGGVSIDRTYDELNRLTSETGAGAEADTTDKTYGYDLAGRRTRYSAPDGDTTYTYNDRGLPLTMTAAHGITATYGYDADGRLTTRTDAAGTASFAYDGDDRLTTSTDAVSGVRALLLRRHILGHTLLR